MGEVHIYIYVGNEQRWQPPLPNDKDGGSQKCGEQRNSQQLKILV